MASSRLWRRKSTLVRAEQFNGLDDLPMAGVYQTATGDPYVITIHKQHTPIVPGDWILPEPDGEHYYPVKHSIFLDTYESVD